MYDYHADIVWAANAAFFVIVILTGVAIFLCVVVKDYLWKRRRRGLLNIKSDVYELVIAGNKSAPPPPVIQQATPQQFIDIETNRARDLVFFNDAEREFFKKSFVKAENIERVAKTALRSWNKWRRIEAILCLGYAGSENAVATIAKTLLSGDRDIAYFSVIALGQIKTVRSARILLEALRKDPSDRYKISSMLDGFPKEIAEDVMSLADDGDAAVRSLALTLLPRFAARRHIKKLEKYTEDPSPEVRASACGCLGAIGSDEAKDALLRCLKDSSWLVKMRAVSALEKVLGDKAVPEVISLISDASWSVNGAVKDVMTSHVEASLPYIEKFLAGTDEIAKKYSVLALQNSGRLSEMLRVAASGKAKEDVIKLLEGVVKSKSHFGLEAALNSFDAETRARALEVLEKMDSTLAGHIDERITGKTGKNGYI